MGQVAESKVTAASAAAQAMSIERLPTASDDVGAVTRYRRQRCCTQIPPSEPDDMWNITFLYMIGQYIIVLENILQIYGSNIRH